MIDSELYLKGERVLVRGLHASHLAQMDGWRPFDDPMQALWNLQRRNSISRDIWFLMHDTDTSRLWFAVERRTDSQLIGTITLREIIVHKEARLGLTFGADYVDQGYGSEAMCLFLPWYFGEAQFRRLLLDVAGSNLRARHVYEKLGFRYIGRHYRDVPSQHSLGFLEQPAFSDVRPYFRQAPGRAQLLFYDMQLDRVDWLAHAQSAAAPLVRHDSAA